MGSISLVSVVSCLVLLQIGLTTQYEQSQNINDWFRREHSLSKPYGGKYIAHSLESQSSLDSLFHLKQVRVQESHTGTLLAVQLSQTNSFG